MNRVLFLGYPTFDDLRAVCQTTHRSQYQRLLSQAQSYQNWLPPAEHPSKSITFIGMAAANLALAYRLSDQAGYLETLQKWLGIAVAYPHWGKERMPDHDLDAAWLLFGLSLAYAWVGEELSIAKRQALHDKLLLQGQKLYKFAIETEERWWSSAYWQNHNWICYTGLATVAYALQNEYPEARGWSRRALENFRIVFNNLPEDGSDYEGVVYWCYGLPWLMIYADLAAQEENADFYKSPFLRNTFYYRLYMSAPNLVDTANFGDCHDRRSAHSRAIYYWITRHYRNGHAQWLVEHFEQTGEWEREAREGLLQPGLRAQAFLELLWYDPTVHAEPISNLPLMRIFPDLGLVGARSSWKPEAAFLAFKNSVPMGIKAWALAHDLKRNRNWDAISAGHLHPDENSFILVRGSDYLAVDEGYSNAKQTAQHNTVLVDGRGQYQEGSYHAAKGLGPEWGARLENAFAGNGVFYASGEAAGAYPPELGLHRFYRQILMWGDSLLLIHDDLVCDQPRKFEWLLQTDTPAQAKKAKQFSICSGDSRLDLSFIEPTEIAPKSLEQDVVAAPTSAQPDYILRRTQHTLSVSPINRQDTVRFLAMFSFGPRPDQPARVERLNCSYGQGARISYKDRQILAGFALEGRFWGVEKSFETDALWLVAESRPDLRISKIAAGACTRTFLNGQLWCAASAPTYFVYQEDGWQVQAKEPSWASLRIPKGAGVEFNGASVEVDPESTMVRLPLPSGESKILFRKETHHGN